MFPMYFGVLLWKSSLFKLWSCNLFATVVVKGRWVWSICPVRLVIWFLWPSSEAGAQAQRAGLQLCMLRHASEAQ